MAGRFSVESVFKAVDRVSAPVSRMQNRVGRFTRSMQRSFTRLNRTINKTGRALRRGAQVATLAVAGMGAAMGATLAPGVAFEQAIVDVGAVSLKTRDQISALEEQALELGRTTKFTATQSANAMEVLARAGFDVNDILKATPAVLSAAAASGLEIADVANHVSNVLKGMGLETGEAARVADVLALASARTNSTIGSLGESMKNAAATSRQLGVPLEDVVASIALLQDVGLDASVAGSAFNVMLTKMAAPSTKIEKVMRRLNLSFKDADGNMKSLPAVIGDITTASAAMGGNFDQVAFLAELVGLRGQKAASNLSRLFETGQLKELTAELQNAAGSADRMAAIRMDTVEGSLLLLGSAVDGVKVKIANLNRGPLKNVIDNMTAWVGDNEEWIATNLAEAIESTIEGVISLTRYVSENGDTILTATKWVLGFIVVLKTLIGVLTLVALVMALNPIGLIVLGVIAAVAAFTALVVWIDEVAVGFDNMHPVLKAILSPLRLLIRLIQFAKNAFTDGLGSAAKTFLESYGFGGDDEDEATGGGIRTRRQRQGRGAHLVSPGDRVAASIEEKRTTSTSEIVIRDDTGRAVVAGPPLSPGVTLSSTGAF